MKGLKNIVITGASQGIGYYTALKYASEGHRVIAIARRGKKLEELVEECLEREYTGFIKALCCDINDVEKIRNVVYEDFGQIDILINNAGKLLNKSFEEIRADELRSIYETNVFAPFTLIQVLKPLFNKDAHIINISSVGGVNGTEKFPGLTAYSSSKAALSCLTECLQAEYGNETDLTFNSLALGAVKTEMLKKAFPGYEPEVTPVQMAEYIYTFGMTAPAVLRGKTVVVSRSNP